MLAVLLAVAIVGIAQLWHVPQARASYNCSAHCAQVAHWAYPTITGTSTVVNMVQLSYSASDGFIDNEIWLYQRNNSRCYSAANGYSNICWIETGYTTRPGYPIQWFEGNYEPNCNCFIQNYEGAVPSGDFGNNRVLEIWKVGSGQWDVEWGDNYNTIASGLGSDNYVELGQELSGGTGTAHAPQAHFTSTEYRDANNNWHYEGGTTIVRYSAAPPPYYSFTYNTSGDDYSSWCCNSTPNTAPIHSAASSAGTPSYQAEASGYAAIQPHGNTTDPAKPAFTADDAKQYAANHPPARAVIDGPITVTGVSFMTGGQASVNLHGAKPHALGTTLLAVVEVAGSFRIPGANGTDMQFKQLYEVYNARTGNLLSVVGF